MRILAIESSGRQGSIGLLVGSADGSLETIGEARLGADTRTAQALAPALANLLSTAGWEPQSIELVTTAVGPGSFTGLRIGVTTAKTFAYAVGAQVIGVNTLDVLAAQARAIARPAPLWTIMDAQRSELFAAKFEARSADAQYETLQATSIVAAETWLEQLKPGDCITGPALSRMASRLPTNVSQSPQSFWQPTAEAVGWIAWRDYCAGRRDDVWSLLPNYYRASAAEERLAEKPT